MSRLLISVALCLGALFVSVSAQVGYTLTSYLASSDARTWQSGGVTIQSILPATSPILIDANGVNFLSCIVLTSPTAEGPPHDTGLVCTPGDQRMICPFSETIDRGTLYLKCEVSIPSATNAPIEFFSKTSNPETLLSSFTGQHAILDTHKAQVVSAHYLADATNTLTFTFTSLFVAPPGTPISITLDSAVSVENDELGCSFEGPGGFEIVNKLNSRTFDTIPALSTITARCTVFSSALSSPPATFFTFGGHNVASGKLAKDIMPYEIQTSITGYTAEARHTLGFFFSTLMSAAAGSEFNFDLNPDIEIQPDSFLPSAPHNAVARVAGNTVTLVFPEPRAPGSDVSFSIGVKLAVNTSSEVGTMRVQLSQDSMERSVLMNNLPHGTLAYTDPEHRPTLHLSTYSTHDIGTFTAEVQALQKYGSGTNIQIILEPPFITSEVATDCTASPPTLSPTFQRAASGAITVIFGDTADIKFGDIFTITCPITTDGSVMNENATPGVMFIRPSDGVDLQAPFKPLGIPVGPASASSEPDGYLINAEMNVGFGLELPRYVPAGQHFHLSIDREATLKEDAFCFSTMAYNGMILVPFSVVNITVSTVANEPHLVVFEAAIDLIPTQEPVFLCPLSFSKLGYQGANVATGAFIGDGSKQLAPVKWNNNWLHPISDYSASPTLGSYLAGHTESSIRVDFNSLLPGDAMTEADRGWIVAVDPAFELKDAPCSSLFAGSVTVNTAKNSITVKVHDDYNALKEFTFTCSVKNLVPFEGSPAMFDVDGKHIFPLMAIVRPVSHYSGEVTLASYKTGVTTQLTVSMTALHTAESWVFRISNSFSMTSQPCTADGSLTITSSSSDVREITVTGSSIRANTPLKFSCAVTNPSSVYDGAKPVALRVGTFTADLGPLPHPVTSIPSATAWLNSYLPKVTTKLFMSLFLIEDGPAGTNYRFEVDPIYTEAGDCEVVKFNSPSGALPTLKDKVITSSTGGLRTGELVLMCPITTPESADPAYLSGAKVRVNSLEVTASLPYAAVLTFEATSSVSSLEASSNQDLTLFVSNPDAYKLDSEHVFTLHSDFSNVRSCVILEASNSLISGSLVTVSGTAVTVKPWSGQIKGNSNYKLKCTVVTPPGPIRDAPIAVFAYKNADGASKTVNIKRPSRDFAKYEATSWLGSFFEFISTSYYVRFKTLVELPGTALITLRFDTLLEQTGGSCRITSPAGETIVKTFSASGNTNTAVFELPQKKAVAFDGEITIRCPVKNPRAAQNLLFAASVSISNAESADTEFPVTRLPQDIHASYSLSKRLFQSRMVHYYAERPTTVYFQFPLLETTQAGTSYNFVIDNAIMFDENLAAPCFGADLQITYAPTDKRKITAKLTARRQSNTILRLECHVLAPRADSDPSGSMATVSFVANQASQVGTFPELVSRTSPDYVLTAGIETLAQGEDNNISLAFPILDDLEKEMAVHLVLNAAYKNRADCTWTGTKTTPDATKISNRYVVDFVVSKTIYAGAHALITCKLRNPDRAIGLDKTPLRVTFSLPDDKEVVLSHSFYIDLVPGFSGLSKLSMYTQQPSVTLTIWLAFPRAVESGDLLMTLNSAFDMSMSSGCAIADVGNFTSFASLSQSDPTSSVITIDFDDFPLGGHLTIECEVSTSSASGLVNPTVTVLHRLNPAVESFNIDNIPFPILATASAETYLSSIIGGSSVRLVNSFWLVTPVPEHTLFLVAIPEATFTSVRECDLYNEQHQSVSLSPALIAIDDGLHVISTNMTSQIAGSRLTCECIVTLPAAGVPFSLDYGPLVLSPPATNLFFVDVSPLPHVPIKMPPPPGPGFLSSLRFNSRQTMELGFVLVDSLLPDTIVTVALNVELVGATCDANRQTFPADSVVKLPISGEPGIFEFSFPKGFPAGSKIQFDCLLTLPKAALKNLVAATVLYDHEVVNENDEIVVETREVDFKLLSNLQRVYTVPVDLGTFKTDQNTVMDISFRMLDKGLTAENAELSFRVHPGLKFSPGVKCTGSGIRGGEVEPLDSPDYTELVIKVDKNTLLGETITLSCPIKTPSQEGRLNSKAVQFGTSTLVTSADVEITDLLFPFVNTFVTTTQLASIQTGETDLHFNFWLYETATDRSNNVFSLPIKTPMINRINSCKVVDASGSTAPFSEMEIPSPDDENPVVSFKMELSERAGQSVTLSCRVAIGPATELDPLDVGPATLSGWTIPFPPLPHHTVSTYVVNARFSSYYGGSVAMITFDFLLLRELVPTNRFTIRMDPMFVATTTNCHVSPDVFSYTSPYAGARLFETKMNQRVYAGTFIAVACEYTLPAKLDAPFTPALLDIHEVSSHRAVPELVSIMSLYKGSHRFSSLVLGYPSTVELSFVALEGFDHNDEIELSFTAPVLLTAADTCVFEGLHVKDMSPDNGKIILTVDDDLEPGHTIRGNCSVVLDSEDSQTMLIAAQFTRSSQQRSVAFVNAKTVFKHNYEVTSLLDNYHTSKATHLYLSVVVLEDIIDDTLIVRPSSVLFSNVVCESDSGGVAGTRDTFQYSFVPAGNTVTFTCAVTTMASEQVAEAEPPAIIIRQVSRLAVNGKPLEIDDGLLPMRISNNRVLRTYLDSYFAEKETKVSLEMNLLETIPANSGTLVSRVTVVFPPALKPTSCKIDDITATVADSTISITPTKRLTAGRRVFVVCSLVTPSSDLTFTTAPKMTYTTPSDSFDFPAFAQPRTFNAYAGSALLANYKVGMASSMEISFIALEGLDKNDQVMFTVPPSSLFTISSCTVAGSLGPWPTAATASLTGSNLKLNLESVSTDAPIILPGGRVTITCVTQNAAGTVNAPIPPVTSQNNAIGEDPAVVIKFSPFPMDLVTEMPISYFLMSYKASITTTFEIEFQPEVRISNYSVLSWNYGDLFTILTEKIHVLAPGAKTFTVMDGKMDTPLQFEIPGGSTVRLVCDVRNGGPNLPTNLKLPNFVIDRGAPEEFPLEDFIMSFREEPYIVEPYRAWHHATSTVSYITLTFKTLQYYFPDDTIVIEVAEVFSKPPAASETTITVGSDATYVLKWDDHDYVFTVTERIPAGTTISLRVAVVTPATNEDLDGASPFISVRAAGEGGMTNFSAPLIDENFSTSLSTYYSHAPSVTVHVSFFVAEKWVATPASPATYEFTFADDAGTSCAPTAVYDPSISWIVVGNTITTLLDTESTANTETKVTIVCTPMISIGTTELFSAVTFFHPDFNLTRPVFLHKLPLPISDRFNAEVKTSNYLQGATNAALRVSFWAIMPLCASASCDDELIITFNSGVTIANPTASCNLRAGSTTVTPNCVPGSIDLCGTKAVRFKLTASIATGTKLLITCTNVQNPNNPGTKDVVGTGKLGSLALNTNTNLFHFTLLPTYVTGPSTVARLSTYRHSTPALLTLTWMMIGDQAMTNADVRLTVTLFASVTGCTIAFDSDDAQYNSITSTASNIRIIGFKALAGTTITLKCNAEARPKESQPENSRDVGSVVLTSGTYDFKLPMSIVDEYTGTTTISTVTAHEIATVTFSLIAFTDFGGFSLSFEPGLFAAADASVVLCTSDFVSGTASFTNIVFTEPTPIDSVIEITCVGPLGNAGAHEVIAHLSGEELIADEEFNFGTIDVVAKIDVSFTGESRMALDNNTLTISFVAPVDLEGYTGVFATSAWFTSVDECTSDFGTLSLADESGSRKSDIEILFKKTAVDAEVSITCVVTNSDPRVTDFTSGVFTSDDAPSMMFGGRYLSRHNEIIGSVIRNSTVENAVTNIEIEFPLVDCDEQDNLVLSIWTGTTIRRLLSDCTLDASGNIFSNITTLSSGGTFTGLSISFAGSSASGLPVMTLKCTAQNGDAQNDASWDASFSVDGASRMPVIFTGIDVDSSIVVGQLLLDSKRAERENTGFKILFETRLPVHGYSLVLNLGAVLASVTASECSQVKQMDDSNEIQVGSVAVSGVRLTVSFHPTAVQDSLFTLSCKGKLGKEASRLPPLTSTFTPPVNTDMPPFGFSLPLPDIVDVVKIEASLSSYYVDDVATLTIPIMPPESLARWTFRINLQSTFTSVSNCAVRDEDDEVLHADEPAVAVANGMRSVSFTFHDAEVIHLALLTCSVSNGERATGIKWGAVAELAGQPSFEFEVSLNDIVYEPPLIDAYLSSSILGDHPVSLYLSFELTFDLKVTDEILFNFKLLFKDNSRITCILRNGEDPVTSSTDNGIWKSTFKYSRPSDIVAGKSIAIECDNLRNPANQADVVAVTGLLADEVPLSFMVSNVFNESAAEGKVSMSSYTSGTKNVNAMFSFVPSRDLMGYTVQITTRPHYELLDECKMLSSTSGNPSNSSVIVEGPSDDEPTAVRTIAMSVNTETPIGVEVSFVCYVDLRDPSPATTFNLTFTRTGSTSIDVPFWIRETVPVPLWTGSFSSSLLGDNSVLANFATKVMFAIPAGAQLTLNMRDLTLQSCNIRVSGGPSVSMRLDNKILTYTFGAEPAEATLAIDCAGITLPVDKPPVIDGSLDTTDAYYGTVLFPVHYTNEMLPQHAVGKAVLGSYLPNTRTSMSVTFTPLKNLENTKLTLSMVNSTTTHTYGYILSCDGIPGILEGNSENDTGRSSIDLSFTGATPLGTPITIVCEVENLGAAPAGRIYAESFSASTILIFKVEFDIDEIIYSLAGSLTQSSSVSGEVSLVTFTVPSFDVDYPSLDIILDVSTFALNVSSCTSPQGSVGSPIIISPAVTFVFEAPIAGTSISWTCTVINGPQTDAHTVTAYVVNTDTQAPDVPIYFPHSGITARLLTSASVGYAGPGFAGSRTTLVFATSPNFAVADSMLFAFPLPDHAANATSEWPITCTATVNGNDVPGATGTTTPVAFVFTGVETEETDADIVFTCHNFPLPTTPRISDSEMFVAAVADHAALDAFLDGEDVGIANGIIAILNTTFPAYPAPTDNEFGGRLAQINYISSAPNSFTPVRFAAAPTILTQITAGTKVRAELAFGVTLRSSAVTCEITNEGNRVTGTTTSATRSEHGIVVIEWEAGSTSPLSPQAQFYFTCSSLTLPPELMPAMPYGSLTVGALTVTSMVSDRVRHAPLGEITSSFTPNQIGTPTSVFAISHVGVDLVGGNTILLPVPSSTSQAVNEAITCRFNGGIAITALLDKGQSHLVIIVAAGLIVSRSDVLACSGLQPPQSTRAVIATDARMRIFASANLKDEFASGTIEDPEILPRVFDSSATRLTIKVDEADTPASFFDRKASVELTVAALPFEQYATTMRITATLPTDMALTGPCLFGDTEEEGYNPNEIPVDVATNNGIATFTFARSLRQWISATPIANGTLAYRISCPTSVVTLPDYIISDSSTLAVDVHASIGDKISTTSTGRIRGGPVPDVGAVTVSTAPWLDHVGGLVLSWDAHVVRFTPGDVVLVEMDMIGAYAFVSTQCSVFNPPTEVTVGVITNNQIELIITDFVEPVAGERFLISCPSVRVPAALGEEPQSPGTLRVLRNNDPDQLKVYAPNVVSFTELTEEPADTVDINVTFEPPSDMSGSHGSVKFILVSPDLVIPAQASLMVPVPRSMWTFPDPVDCSGSTAGSAHSIIMDGFTQITFTFANNVPRNTPFTLVCRNARATAAYRAAATVVAVVRLDSKEIAMDRSVEIPPLLGVIGAGASLVFRADTVGAVGTVEVSVPEIAATLVGAISIVVSVPPGTFMSDDTSVCTASTSSGAATVLATAIADDEATYTSALAATMDVGTLTIGASINFACTNVRASFAPVPAAEEGPENPYVVYVHLADGSPAARSELIFGGIKAITKLPEMDVTFSTNAGARAGLLITLSAPGFALPADSRVSVRVAKEAVRVADATRCAINSKYDALLEPANAADEGSVVIVAADEVPANVEVVEVFCPNAFQLPDYEVKWTTTKLVVALPFGRNSTLVDTFDMTVPYAGVRPAALSVSISPADARVAISSELVFSILPTTVDAKAGDVLVITGPTLFDYHVEDDATCSLQGGSSSTKIDLSVESNADGIHTSYTLAFPDGIALKGNNKVVVTCGPVTTPSRALAEMQTQVVLRNTVTGNGARVRGSAPRGAVFTAITPISFGSRWSRIKPQSTVAASGFGDLTVVLSPITADLPIRSTFVITLPSTWTVTTNAFGCSASFGSALVADATVPMLVSVPQVTSAENKVIRITSAQLAIPRTSQTFRIFCSNAVRVPGVETPAVEGPFVSVFDSNNMPLMQAPRVQLPAITANASPVPMVTARVTTAVPAKMRSTTFKMTSKDAEVLHVVFANALNMPLTNAIVRSVVLGENSITFEMALLPTAATSVEDIMDKITERGPALLSQLQATMRMPVLSVQLPVETTLRATCADRRMNGEETDVDCGGPFCLPCTETRMCAAPTDCELGTCSSGVCSGRTNSATGGASTAFAIVLAVAATLVATFIM